MLGGGERGLGGGERGVLGGGGAAAGAGERLGVDDGLDEQELRSFADKL